MNPSTSIGRTLFMIFFSVLVICAGLVAISSFGIALITALKL